MVIEKMCPADAFWPISEVSRRSGIVSRHNKERKVEKLGRLGRAGRLRERLLRKSRDES